MLEKLSIQAAKGENPDYIEVKWDRVPMANQYLIYRGEKENGLGMEQLNAVSGNKTVYQDRLSSNEKGVEFYYKVCAVLSDGSPSAFTGLALGYSAKEGAPNAPKSVEVTNGLGVSNKSLDIQWLPPDNVNTTIYDYKYAVYRTSSVDSIFTPVDTTTSTAITDNSLLKPGIKYFYYVQTIATKKEGQSDLLFVNCSRDDPTRTDDPHVPNVVR